jgi:hypothetical protein
MDNAPRMRWPIILGAAGFAAGFFGPMLFVPDANQGPMVGIFISGPAGALLGAALYGICRLLKLSSKNQWRLLTGVAIAGVLATLLLVQPSPALQGSLYTAEVISCSSPGGAAAKTLVYWDQRIAEVNWAAPRDGWQQEMRATLQDAPGAVVDVQVKRVNAVYQNRKPWNRGTLFATGWVDKTEERSFYLPQNSCADYSARQELSGFLEYEYNGKMEPPNTWPPQALEQVINASPYSEVPQRFAEFQ